MKLWQVGLLLAGIGIVGWYAWKRYRDQLALQTLMADPRGVAKMGIDSIVDKKVNQQLNRGIDFLAGKLGV